MASRMWPHLPNWAGAKKRQVSRWPGDGHIDFLIIPGHIWGVLGPINMAHILMGGSSRVCGHFLALGRLF